jgi:hypothetical protein
MNWIKDKFSGGGEEEPMAVDPMAGQEGFLGGQPGDHIHQGGEFLPVDTEASQKAIQEDIIQNVEDHLKAVADIAALEHHPGFIAIIEKLDEMIEDERNAQEYALEASLTHEEAVFDPAQASMNVYSVLKLKKFKLWLLGHSQELKEMHDSAIQ